MLEHGANLDGELRTALPALLEAVANDALGVLYGRLRTDARKVINATGNDATMRTRNPVGPDHLL